MLLKTSFLLLVVAGFLFVSAEEEGGKKGEEVNEVAVEAVEEEDNEDDEEDDTVPFTCFVTAPKSCQTKQFELADFLALSDNAFPGLIFKVDPSTKVDGVPKAAFFNEKKQFLGIKPMGDVNHRNLLSFFEENDFPLVNLETFKYSINSEFDFAGHHYMVALMRVPYIMAAELAKMREFEVNGKMEKGYLVQIDSEEEQQRVFEELSLPFSKLMGFGIWLGGHKDMEKTWFWEDGEHDGEEFFNFNTGISNMYTNWGPERPFKNDKNTHRCVIMNKRGDWLDDNCFTTTKSVVFEFGTAPQIIEKNEETQEKQEEEKSEL